MPQLKLVSVSRDCLEQPAIVLVRTARVFLNDNTPNAFCPDRQRANHVSFRRPQNIFPFSVNHVIQIMQRKNVNVLKSIKSHKAVLKGLICQPAASVLHDQIQNIQLPCTAQWFTSLLTVLSVFDVHIIALIYCPQKLPFNTKFTLSA